MDLPDLAPLGVPFISTIVPFVFVIVIVALKSAEKSRRDKMRCDLIRLAIEKGQPVPPELMRTEESHAHGREGGRNDTRAGLICVAAGIGVFLLLRNLPGAERVAWAGAIPAFIGVALIISGIFLHPKPAASATTPPTVGDLEKR